MDSVYALSPVLPVEFLAFPQNWISISYLCYNTADTKDGRGVILANNEKTGGSGRDASDQERLKTRMDLLDDRLDNIDSILTAVAERVMKQPVTITLHCPHCGKNIEISLVGQQKPT